MKSIKSIFKSLLGERILFALQIILNKNKSFNQCLHYFKYDMNRFYQYSGAYHNNTFESLRGKIIRFYHIVEKGLTMPERRNGFGKEVIVQLIKYIELFEEKYGKRDEQVNHAVEVIHSYRIMHEQLQDNPLLAEQKFWIDVCDFCERHNEQPCSKQLHYTYEEFYSGSCKEFPEFANSRHTVRHYVSDKKVSEELIRKAVDVARTAPSACNRQHCHVYCLADRNIMEKVLKIQGGSRGFGHLADKLLVITSNLEDTIDIRERTDVFTNGGLFLMQLCNALYYHKIGYCILNWTKSPEDDIYLRNVLPIKAEETVISLVVCGIVPEEFDVAASPRKKIDDYLTFIR